MRTLLIALMTLFALAACEPLPVVPVVPASQPQFGQRVLPEPEVLAPPVAVEAAPLAAPLPPPDPPMLAQQRAACQREGGQMMQRGQGLFACVTPTRDAGRQCTAASDCEGLCLARSGTCAPLTPIFGCQEVFDASGQRETLCTE